MSSPPPTRQSALDKPEYSGPDPEKMDVDLIIDQLGLMRRQDHLPRVLYDVRKGDFVYKECTITDASEQHNHCPSRKRHPADIYLRTRKREHIHMAPHLHLTRPVATISSAVLWICKIMIVAEVRADLVSACVGTADERREANLVPGRGGTSAVIRGEGTSP